MKSLQRAFTLIEVMIVVAIIGILAAIAYPSYTQYKIKTNRVDMQAQMMNIVQKLQSYKVIHHGYREVNLAELGVSETYPQTGEYTLNLIIDQDKQGYLLRATPNQTTIQKNNGQICINHEGFKYWEKGKDCNEFKLNSQSSWDN